MVARHSDQSARAAPEAVPFIRISKPRRRTIKEEKIQPRPRPGCVGLSNRWYEKNQQEQILLIDKQ